jgi:ABC-type sugar transport system permease subunit
MDHLSSTRIVTESKPNWVARLVIGLLLLIPGLLLYGSVQLSAGLEVIQLSQTDYNLLSPPEFVGMANYSQLAEDRNFIAAIPFTLRILLARLFVVAVIPPLIGLLIGAQGRAWRNINRVLLTIIGVLVSPVAIAVLASGFFSRIWGRQPSPLFSDTLILGSLETAPIAILLLDSLITLGVAAAVGGAVFMAVMRGRREGSSITATAVGVWLLGIFFALASTPQMFDLPFVMTEGGPANSTMTMALIFYRNAFLTLRVGYAASMAAIWIVDAIIAALLVWCILVLFRLRLTYVSAAKSSNDKNSLAALTIPLLLLIGIPLVGLVLWGVWQAGFSTREDVNLAQVLNNTVVVPWLTIWLVQIPITYLTGLVLGWVRPLGRIGSNLLFLFFLILAFLPGEALLVSWFKQAADAGALDSSPVLGVSVLVSAFSLIVFKLFFDGAYTRFEEARASGQTTSDAFLRSVFLPSLSVTLIVGSVLSFASAQALLWPLIAIRSRELFGFPATLLTLRGQFATDYAPVIGASLIFIGLMALLFLPLLALLQILFLDRLALVGGAQDTATELETETV